MAQPYIPPHQARNEEQYLVDAFFSSISPPALIYARRQMHHCVAFWKGFAGLQDLPAELICIISSHLSLLDIHKCRLVSTGWRRTWSDYYVVSYVSRIHFEGLVETVTEKSDIASVFDKALRSSLARHYGCAKHTTIDWPYYGAKPRRHMRFPSLFRRLPQADENSSVSAPRNFSVNEKAAIWSSSGDTALLADLCRLDGYRPCYKCVLPTTKCVINANHYVFWRPSHYLLSLDQEHLRNNCVEVFNEHIIVSCQTYSSGREHQLRSFVWHRETREVRDLHVPYMDHHLKKATVHREVVYLIIGRHDYLNKILYYRWDGDVQEIVDYHLELKSTTNFKDFMDTGHPQGPNIMFPADDPSVFFLAFKYQGRGRVCAIEVIKYVDGVGAQHYFYGPFTNPDITDQKLLLTRLHNRPGQCKPVFDDHITYSAFQSNRMNKFGLWTLMILGTPQTHDNITTSFGGVSRGFCYPEEWRAICFNVCTECFSRRSYEDAHSSSQARLYSVNIFGVVAWGYELWVSGVYFRAQDDRILCLKKFVDPSSLGAGAVVATQDHMPEWTRYDPRLDKTDMRNPMGVLVDDEHLIFWGDKGAVIFSWEHLLYPDLDSGNQTGTKGG